MHFTNPLIGVASIYTVDEESRKIGIRNVYMLEAPAHNYTQLQCLAIRENAPKVALSAHQANPSARQHETPNIAQPQIE